MAKTPSNLRSLMGMLRYELLSGLRTAAWRGMAVMALLYGLSLGHTDGSGCGVAALDAGETGCRLFSLVTAVWMSITALKDGTSRIRTILLSRPQPGETLAIQRFIGGYIQSVGLLLALFVGAIGMRILGGTPVAQLVAFVPQFVRASGACFFAASLAFMLSALSDSPIAGLLGGLYSLLILAGKEYLARIYDPAPVQNTAAYCAVGLAIVLFTARFYRSKRRGSAPAPVWGVPGGSLAVAAAVVLFTSTARNGHDPHTHLNPSLELIAAQDTQPGLRAAGFLLPDQNGTQVTLADFTGRVLVVVLFSPHDVDTGATLTMLNDVQKRYAAKGVQVVGVCLSEDNSAGPALAKGDALQFPVVTDWGTNAVPEKLAMSPVAGAYRATALPCVAVTDRRKRVIDIVRGATVTDGRSVVELIEKAISAEPVWQ
jgi:peroxiredoxin